MKNKVLMLLPYLLPLALGSLVVLQPTLNRIISLKLGHLFAAWFNSVVLFTVASTFLILSFQGQYSAASEQFSQFGEAFRPWFLLPGMFGFILVFAVPFCFKNFGALTTMTGMLSGQVLMSLLIDTKYQGIAISKERIIGIILVLAGASLTAR